MTKPAKTKPVPRKTPKRSREFQYNLRASAEEREAFDRECARVGKNWNDWARGILRAASGLPT